jgi:hypothetical protein
MSLLDKVQKLEKRLEKLAERTDVALEPLEVRRAALDELEDLVQPSGRAKRVFPYDRVVVEVVAPDARRRVAMEAVLGEGSDMASAVADRLKAAGCGVPRGLEVSARVVKRAGAEWETGRVFRVICERRADGLAARSGVGAAVPAAAGTATLTVVKGETTRKSVTLSAERTNIGRLAEVVDHEKRVVRRNQVVFTEREDGINRTVSRAHAHIALTPSGEYRLFDDHSSYGTRIFRGGRTIPLPSGSPRGTKLQSADEIYLGQACLRFEIKQG